MYAQPSSSIRRMACVFLRCMHNLETAFGQCLLLSTVHVLPWNSIGPMPCIVYGTCITLKQQWANALCFRWWSDLYVYHNHSARTRKWTNIGLMLAQRRRRWANITPTLVQRILIDGRVVDFIQQSSLTLLMVFSCAFVLLINSDGGHKIWYSFVASYMEKYYNYNDLYCHSQSVHSMKWCKYHPTILKLYVDGEETFVSLKPRLLNGKRTLAW